MATIKDVAEKAGVSTATVSRALNSNYPVSKETHDRVMKAVEATGYRINILAKSLRTDKTYMVGLVVPDISNPYFMNIARGLEQAITPFGYTLTFCSTDEDPAKEIKILEALKDKRVDYVVLASSLEDGAYLEQLKAQGLKLIMVDTMLDNLKVDFVVEENEDASYRLVDYAVKMGHKKIGIVNGIMHISTARERYSGYVSALQDNGLTVDERYTVNGGYYRQIAYENVKAMLLEHADDRPTLIYATNNQMTEGTLMAVKELGLSVPEDISVVSFGELTLAELIEPKMTIIEQNSTAIGQEAGEILMNRLERGNNSSVPTTHIIKSELVVRKSVKHLTE